MIKREVFELSAPRLLLGTFVFILTMIGLGLLAFTIGFLFLTKIGVI